MYYFIVGVVKAIQSLTTQSTTNINLTKNKLPPVCWPKSSKISKASVCHRSLFASPYLVSPVWQHLELVPSKLTEFTVSVKENSWPCTWHSKNQSYCSKQRYYPANCIKKQIHMLLACSDTSGSIKIKLMLSTVFCVQQQTDLWSFENLNFLI